VAIISDGYWQRRFRRDPAAVGHPIDIDGQTFVIVGVAAPGFAGVLPAYRVDLWAPLSAWPMIRPTDPRSARPDDPARCCVSVAARLRDDVSAGEVEAELDTLSRAFRQSARVEGGGVVVRETGGLPGDPTRVMAIVSAILAAPLAVLALACANVGNLQLGRDLRRRAEIAMRLSLGASRARVTRQLVTEALLLAALAGGGGLLIAQLLPAALPIILDLLDESDVFPFEQFVPDARVVLFTIGVCASACLIFGLAPALTITRLGAQAVADGRHGGGPGVARLRTILMGAQIAVCTALLCIAGLLSRGIVEAARIDPGFDTTDVQVAPLTATIRQQLADAIELAARGRSARWRSSWPRSGSSASSPSSSRSASARSAFGWRSARGVYRFWAPSSSSCGARRLAASPPASSSPPAAHRSSGRNCMASARSTRWRSAASRCC
jgi:HAMP domain-containing protein